MNYLKSRLSIHPWHNLAGTTDIHDMIWHVLSQIEIPMFGWCVLVVGCGGVVGVRETGMSVDDAMWLFAIGVSNTREHTSRGGIYVYKQSNISILCLREERPPSDACTPLSTRTCYIYIQQTHTECLPNRCSQDELSYTHMCISVRMCRQLPHICTKPH